MKKWALVEEIKNCVGTITPYNSKEEAIEEATRLWNSEPEKEKTTAFYVGLFDFDEDGNAGLDCLEVAIDFLTLPKTMYYVAYKEDGEQYIKSDGDEAVFDTLQEAVDYICLFCEETASELYIEAIEDGRQLAQFDTDGNEI